MIFVCVDPNPNPKSNPNPKTINCDILIKITGLYYKLFYHVETYKFSNDICVC